MMNRAYRHPLLELPSPLPQANWSLTRFTKFVDLVKSLMGKHWDSCHKLPVFSGLIFCFYIQKQIVLFRRTDYYYYYYYYLVCEAIGTAGTPGLLCQPRVIVKMIVEKQMECILAGETQVFGENLPQRQFCPSQNPTWPDPGLNPGRRGGKPATNSLSYGAALIVLCL
jgi:hypothetical protein